MSDSGPGRAAGDEHVHRHDLVHALHERVVVEHAAHRRAGAHRDHPLGLGHLVVDAAQHRRHLPRHAPGDDHQVGLARRGAEHLGAEPRDVVARATHRHHLDGAARQPEGDGPDRRPLRPVDDPLDGRQEERHVVLRALQRRRPWSGCLATGCQGAWCRVPIGKRAAARRRFRPAGPPSAQMRSSLPQSSTPFRHSYTNARACGVRKATMAK